MKPLTLTALSLLGLTCQIQTLAATDAFITALSCEWNQRHTLGIQTAKPQFNWHFQGEAPTVLPRQSEICIAETIQDLTTGHYLWSKRSDNLFSCRYDGDVLKPGVLYVWKVRLLDADGKALMTRGCGPDGWSQQTGCFSIGLQQLADWENAQWISEDTVHIDWHDMDVETCFTLQKNAYGMVFHARPADPLHGYMWQINLTGQEALLRPHVFKEGIFSKLLPVVRLADFFPQGIDWKQQHRLKISVRGITIKTYLDGILIQDITDDTHTSGTIGVRTSNGEEALVHELMVRDVDGKTLLSDSFSGHILPAFHHPTIINDSLSLKNSLLLHTGILHKNAPRMRKQFLLADKPIRSAVASACGFGFYELWLNGQKADPERVMAPGWCGNRSLFDTYDVTALLQRGTANTVGFWLAAGYSDDFSRYAPHWLRSKRALLHLAVTYEDGTRQTIVTDGSWEWTPHSPITHATIYDGEHYDATLEDVAWCTPQGTAAGWKPVTVVPATEQPRLLANDEPPVRMRDPRAAVKITEPKPGVFVAHFVQNRAGFLRIRVKGPRGTVIRLHTSELLGKDGNIDPWTNRSAQSTDVFTLAGTGDTETYMPRFTYHGFQFVEITGWPGKPQPKDIVSIAVCADVETIGTFDCSNEGLNRFMNAAKWSMLANFMSYPTDCPMRNERTPCMMDSQAYEDAAFQYFNVARYYAKWLEDGRGSYGNPDWNGDMATLPWRLYLNTGDERFLETFYHDNIQAQIDRHVKSHPELVWPKQGFGDWCAPNNGSWQDYFHDVDIVNSSILCDMLRIAADSAALLNKQEAQTYAQLAVQSREAFHRFFYDTDSHCYGSGRQVTAAMPLAFGLVPKACRQDVIAHLLKTIREQDGSKINAGIYGSRYLGDVLCDAHESDLWVHIMTQPEYPGFGFMLANDATTLWEQWSFRGGMNSHNHAMLSGASHTLMTRLAGIRPAAPGYAAIEIRPSFPSTVDWVRASRETPRGTIRCEWRRSADTSLSLTILIPPYTPAKLTLPDGRSIALKAGENTLTAEHL